jgi:hypothetical protein
MRSPEDSSGFEFRASDELSAGYRYTTPQPTVGDGLKSPNIKCERITHARPLFRFCVVVHRRAGVYRVKSAECPTSVKDNRVSDGTACNVELRQGGVAADEESVPDAWTDLAQGDTQLRETGQFRWLVHGWSVAQCAVSLKVSPRN